MPATGRGRRGVEGEAVLRRVVVVSVCVGLVVWMRDWAIIFGLTLRPSLRYYRVRQVVVDGGLGWDVLTWPST